MQQHREPGGALNERADRRLVQSDDEVTFPMPWNGTVLDFRWSSADHDLGRDEAVAALSSARHPQRPAGAQACDQLPAQRSEALDAERMVDRLMGDPLGPIMREVDASPVRDLFRAPRLGPTSVLTATVATADPAHLGPRQQPAVTSSDHADDTVLNVATQPVIGGEFGDLRAASTPLRMPLRRRRPILQAIRTRGRVAA